MIRFIFTGLVSVALVAAIVSESSARRPTRWRRWWCRGGIGGMSGQPWRWWMRGNPGGGPSFGGSSAGRSPSMSGARSPGSGGFSPSGSRRNGSAGFQQGGTAPSSGAPGGTRPGDSRIPSVDPLVFRQPVHDRVVLHSNVQASRLGLLPSSDDLATEALPISNLAVSSICRAIVISVGKAPSLIAGSNDLHSGVQSPWRRHSGCRTTRSGARPSSGIGGRQDGTTQKHRRPSPG